MYFLADYLVSACLFDYFILFYFLDNKRNCIVTNIDDFRNTGVYCSKNIAFNDIVEFFDNCY